VRTLDNCKFIKALITTVNRDETGERSGAPALSGSLIGARSSKGDVMARTKSVPIGKSARRTRESLRSAVRLQDPEPVVVRRLPAATTDEWDWQLQAACRGMDGAWFFPPDREQAKARTSRISRAKAVCARCPALMACRDFALDNGELFGVWGGLSEDDRIKAVSA
jgi:WhiB family redox-sensing transcriptional regulator